MLHRVSCVAALLLSAAALCRADLEKGNALYRSNCAFCHGLTGLGGRGPDLVTNPGSPADVKRIIKQGVPGTTMPAFGSFEEGELNHLVDYVKHLAGSAPSGEKAKGDPARGQVLYAKFACPSCHQI
ncbi:MAG TPA: cytochrome c [Bryobacteraceae bacterium]|nr:cytochrome c [Bryobacteraceae bacterium]